MRLKSKYQGTCTVCGDGIAVGQDVEWSKDEGARHPTCTPSPIVHDTSIPSYVLTDDDPVFRIARVNLNRKPIETKRDDSNLTLR